MDKYKLSIVALVYNLEEYLPRCLDSLVSQTLEDIEILCVDDGSKDSAPQIIDEYAHKYPQKVKAFHKENGGEFTTRNYGLERATGEYVTFVDTDDQVELTWAEKLYNTAKQNDADKSKREEISRPETSGTTQQKSSSAFYPYGAGANLLDWSHSLIPDCIIFRTVCTFSWQPHPLTLIECF